MEQMLLKRVGTAGSAEIGTALKLGAYAALEPAFRMRPADVVHEVKQSGLRGRGGAGFPTGLKWEFCSGAPGGQKCLLCNADAREPGGQKYLLCNADEGEPGTFKDRFILEHDPHLLIEGMIISGYAIGAEQGYIYIRAEYRAQQDILVKAVAQAYERGYLGRNILGTGVNFDLTVHPGAGAYICGEETALIESLEGRRGQPRMRPPFPAVEGAWRKPTVVNNVETLAAIPFVITLTAVGFQKIGEEGSPGPKLFAVSGAVNKPGGYELPMGTTLRELIFDHCGGIRGGRKLKAVIPGGASTPMLTADHLDVKLDFKSLVAAGSMLGSGAVIVMDDSTCMVSAAAVLIRFFKHESCGKCTPCREGTGWLFQIYKRMLNGQGRDGDTDLLLRICDSMQGKCFCPLGEGAIQPVLSSIRYFRADYEKCAGGGCGEKICRPLVH